MRLIPVDPNDEDEMDDLLRLGKEAKVRLVDGGQVFIAKLKKDRKSIHFTPYLDDLTLARRKKNQTQALSELNELFE